MQTTMQSLALPDRRTLAWAEYGDPHGTPVLYHHGAPSSRLEPTAFGLDQAARSAGIRLIAPDRPGCGGSTSQGGRTVLDWPRDAAALCEHLRLPRAGVLGYSGGAPYALALAHALPQRVHAVVLVAPVAHLAPDLTDGLDPFGLRVKRLAHDRPAVARLVLRASMALPARLAPRRVTAMMAARMPAPDRAVATTTPFSCAFPEVVREAFRTGPRGPQHDMALMGGDWGFNPAELTTPVTLWQGTKDSLGARPAMAKHLHQAIHASQLRITSDGHLSLLTTHSTEILQEFTTADRLTDSVAHAVSEPDSQAGPQWGSNPAGAQASRAIASRDNAAPRH